MSYSVSIHPLAEDDFDELFAYIAARSPEGALRWEDAFEGLKNRLATNPHQFGSAREDRWLNLGLHAAPFKTRRGATYQAVYVIHDRKVVVLRVRGPGQPGLTRSELP